MNTKTRQVAESIARRGVPFSWLNNEDEYKAALNWFANEIEQAIRNDRKRCARNIGPIMENHKHHCTNSVNAGALWIEIDAAIRKED